MKNILKFIEPFRLHKKFFLDSHPNFVKNWGGWEVYFFIYIFLTVLKNRTVLKETFNNLNLNCQNEIMININV